MSHAGRTGKIEDRQAGFGPCRADGDGPRVGLLGRAGEAARRLIAPMQERGWEVIFLGTAPAPAMLARLGAILLLLDADSISSAELLGPLLEAAAGVGVGLVAIGGTTTAAERVAGLQAGLDGWIDADSEPREAVARLAAVMRPGLERERLARAIRTHGELDVRRDLFDAVVGERRADLTTREYELLELLCACAGAVVSREQIHRRLWHREPPAGDRTVDVLVSRIRRKLKSVSPGWGYLHTHPGAGYRFAAEPLAAAVASAALAVA